MDSTFDKRERAYRRFNEILEVHNAAITAFRVLQAMPDAPDIVSATLRLKKGMRPAFPAREVQEAANSMLQTINDETERGYEVIRGSALVAVCSAFEHLVKATFVNQGEDNSHEATALLAKTKIRLSASEVLAMSRSEQWFAIADRLFEQLAEQQPNMHVRVRQFLL